MGRSDAVCGGLSELNSEATPSGLPAISPSRGERTRGTEAAISPPEGVAAAVADGDGKPTVWLSKLQGAGRPEGVASGLGTGGPPPLRAVFATARRALAAAGVAGPGFEARLLLEDLAGVPATVLIAETERVVPADQLRRIEEALARRAAGEPLHRILGWREFYGLRLDLSPDTLEPRPDTETLVDAVLPFVRETVLRDGVCRILDLGTGTGAIALALLHQVEGAEALGADVSVGAVRTAAANATRLGLAGRFRTVRSDWLERISGRFHLIVANPPYISSEELSGLPAAVARFDPARALDGGPDGMDAYRRIAGGWRSRLEKRGRLAVEIGHRQRDDVTLLFASQGLPLLSAHRDLGGNDRVLVFQAGENAAEDGESAARPLGKTGECR